MKKIDTIAENEEAVRNINGLFQYRMERGLTLKELSQLISMSTRTLYEIEITHSMPTIKTYNKLAQYFGWEKITRKTPSKPQRPPQSLQEEDVFSMNTVKTSESMTYKFEEGHSYRIIAREANKSQNQVLTEEEYVFRYEGKQGIHHVFREVRGKWTRTYTDPQLIGKYIKEVE